MKKEGLIENWAEIARFRQKHRLGFYVLMMLGSGDLIFH